MEITSLEKLCVARELQVWNHKRAFSQHRFIYSKEMMSRGKRRNFECDSRIFYRFSFTNYLLNFNDIAIPWIRGESPCLTSLDILIIIEMQLSAVEFAVFIYAFRVSTR